MFVTLKFIAAGCVQNVLPVALTIQTAMCLGESLFDDPPAPFPATQALGFCESNFWAQDPESVHTYGSYSSDHEKKPNHKQSEYNLRLPKDILSVTDRK
jgi:hypothetical protein